MFIKWLKKYSHYKNKIRELTASHWRKRSHTHLDQFGLRLRINTRILTFIYSKHCFSKHENLFPSSQLSDIFERSFECKYVMLQRRSSGRIILHLWEQGLSVFHTGSVNSGTFPFETHSVIFWNRKIIQPL